MDVVQAGVLPVARVLSVRRREVPESGHNVGSDRVPVSIFFFFFLFFLSFFLMRLYIDGWSTVGLLGCTCPAMTVGTATLWALDRVRERALGYVDLAQIPDRQ